VPARNKLERERRRRNQTRLGKWGVKGGGTSEQTISNCYRNTVRYSSFPRVKWGLRRGGYTGKTVHDKPKARAELGNGVISKHLRETVSRSQRKWYVKLEARSHIKNREVSEENPKRARRNSQTFIQSRTWTQRRN